MCDASDYAVGAVLGQHIDKKPTVIFYVSKMLADAQLHYTTTEKEVLVVIFALKKFRPYTLRQQDHCVYQSCSFKLLALQERDQTVTDSMGSPSSRI